MNYPLLIAALLAFLVVESVQFKKPPRPPFVVVR